MDEENYIIIVDLALKGIETSLLNKWQNASNDHLFLILLNSYNASSIGMQEIKSDISKVKWERIYTFDPIEAKKYKWDYLGFSYYSGKTTEVSGASIKSDIYFVGGIKGGRGAKIQALARSLVEQGVVIDFNVMLTGKSKIEAHRDVTGLHYYTAKQWIPYQQVLSSVACTNVILDIVQEGQNGPSLRYFEAVVLNKRLLTTNPTIKVLPYYDPRYMKVIDDLNTVDVQWIKDDSPVDYHYAGDFSPTRLLEKIG